MATINQYRPFPYSGSQVIVASERVHLHARNDSVLMFARQSIGLSSQGTINLDCNEKVTFNSPRIYLGLRAEENLILGKTFVRSLRDFLTALESGTTFMQGVGSENPGPSFSSIGSGAKTINKASKKLLEDLDGVLSTVSYTE